LFWSEDEKEVNDSSNIHTYNSNTVRRNLRPSSVIKIIITSYVVAGSSIIRYDEEKLSLTPGVEELMKERGDPVLVRIRYGVTERYHSNSKATLLGCMCVGGGTSQRSHSSNHDKHTTSPNIPTLDTALCGVIETDGRCGSNSLRPPTRCLSNYYSNPAN
jgi:hypothetical protein